MWNPHPLSPPRCLSSHIWFFIADPLTISCDKMARKQKQKHLSLIFSLCTYFSPFLLVIRKKRYQNKATLLIILERKENGKKLFINMKFHSGPDSEPKSYTFEKEAGWDLSKKERLLGRYINKKVIPPRGSFWHSPSFHTLSLLPMILSHYPTESQLWGTEVAQTRSWGNLSHRLADSVWEFGKGTFPALGPDEFPEPQTETWNVFFPSKQFNKSSWGPMTLILLKMYDGLVLIMFLGSLLGLINNQSFQGTLCTPMGYLGFPGLD